LMKSISPMRISPQVRLNPEIPTTQTIYRKNRILSYEIGSRAVLAVV
jgi:hypothetical protein